MGQDLQRPQLSRIEQDRSECEAGLAETSGARLQQQLALEKMLCLEPCGCTLGQTALRSTRCCSTSGEMGWHKSHGSHESGHDESAVGLLCHCNTTRHCNTFCSCGQRACQSSTF